MLTHIASGAARRFARPVLLDSALFGAQSLRDLAVAKPFRDDPDNLVIARC